jgi:hypothetical protein
MPPKTSRKASEKKFPQLVTLPRYFQRFLCNTAPKSLYSETKFHKILGAILKKYNLEEDWKELKITSEAIFAQIGRTKKFGFRYSSFYVDIPELRNVRLVINDLSRILVMLAKQDSKPALSNIKELKAYLDRWMERGGR